MDRDVTFGVGLVTAQRPSFESRTQSEILNDVVNACQAIEAAGVNSVWFSEHHFFDDSYLSSVFPVLGAVAARTANLRIATGILAAHFYDPIRLAEDAATVDLLSEGRLVLGLGHGWRAAEFETFGVDKIGLGVKLERLIGELRSSWSADGSVRGVSVTPKPHGPGGIPVWIGGKAAAQCRRAGALADGFVSQSGDVEEIRRAAALVAEGAQGAGRCLTDFEFGAMLPIFPWGGADGKAVVGDGVRHVYSKYRQMADKVFTPPPSVSAGEDDPHRIDRELMSGDPEAMAEVVAASIAAIRASLPQARIHVIARSWWPGLSTEVIEASARVFMDRVVPAALGR